MNSIQDVLDFVENWKANNGYTKCDIHLNHSLKFISNYCNRISDIVPSCFPHYP